jgi:hypothetical protein
VSIALINAYWHAQKSFGMAAIVWYHAAMKEFFHGWRRKTGLVTLVLACLFASLWVRSVSWLDNIPVRIGTGHVLDFRTFAGGIYVCHVSDRTGDAVDSYFLTGHWINWRTAANTEEIGVEDPLFMTLMEKSRLGFSFHCGSEEPASFSIFILPHYFLTISLTLISAYLILWKPRKPKSSDQPAISNLISN